MTTGENSDKPKLRREDADRPRSQKWFLFKHNISENQPPKLIRRGDVKKFPFFDLERRVVPTLFPLQIVLQSLNLVCKLSSGS